MTKTSIASQENPDWLPMANAGRPQVCLCEVLSLIYVFLVMVNGGWGLSGASYLTIGRNPRSLLTASPQGEACPCSRLHSVRSKVLVKIERARRCTATRSSGRLLLPRPPFQGRPLGGALGNSYLVIYG